MEFLVWYILPVFFNLTVLKLCDNPLIRCNPTSFMILLSISPIINITIGMLHCAYGLEKYFSKIPEKIIKWFENK